MTNSINGKIGVYRNGLVGDIIDKDHGTATLNENTLNLITVWMPQRKPKTETNIKYVDIERLDYSPKQTFFKANLKIYTYSGKIFSIEKNKEEKLLSFYHDLSQKIN